MTGTRQPATPAAGSITSWFTPAPGPIAAVAEPEAVKRLMRQLRTAAGAHGDTAWLHPGAPGDRSTLANLSQDLLDAIGAVGLSTPRAVGEAHLLRPVVHLIHGPVRHLIVDDVATIDTDTLTELHQICLVGSTQLWLLVDLSDQPARRDSGAQPVAGLMEWINDTCTTEPADTVLRRWRQRPVAGACLPPPVRWWHDPFTETTWSDHRRHNVVHAGPTEQVECFLDLARQALTLGHVTATHVRARVIDYLNHPQTKPEHQWALRAAGRDFYTPGIDALGQTHPEASDAALADVTPNGSAVRTSGGWIPIAPMRQQAVARLRTSRRLAGCLPSEPIAGIFDKEPGTPPRRR